MVAFARMLPVAEAERRLNQWPTAYREQAEALHHPARRAAFVSVRCLLQTLLEKYYPASAADWVLAQNSLGAPTLRHKCDAAPGARHHPPPAVSLSHSCGWLACGLGEVSRLGVDIEVCDPTRDVAALAQEIMHARELRRFERRSAARRVAAFYETWVCKEALGKALGVGLGYAQREVALAGGRVRISPRGLLAQPERWSCRLVDSLPGYRLGVVVGLETGERVRVVEGGRIALT